MLRIARSLTCFLAISILFLAGDALAGDGALDHATVLAPAPAGDPRIIVELFGTANADYGTGEREDKPKAQEAASQMQATAPITLAQSIVAQLGTRDVLGGAELVSGTAAPAGALRLRGEFTVLNPGSRGKRFWVGMGAGRSRVCVKGELVDADGKSLLTFEHCRSGTGAYSFVGGRPQGMMINDLAGTAEKIALFLSQWEGGVRSP